MGFIVGVDNRSLLRYRVGSANVSDGQSSGIDDTRRMYERIVTWQSSSLIAVVVSHGQNACSVGWHLEPKRGERYETAEVVS